MAIAVASAVAGGSVVRTIPCPVASPVVVARGHPCAHNGTGAVRGRSQVILGRSGLLPEDLRAGQPGDDPVARLPVRIPAHLAATCSAAIFPAGWNVVGGLHARPLLGERAARDCDRPWR